MERRTRVEPGPCATALGKSLLHVAGRSRIEISNVELGSLTQKPKVKRFGRSAEFSPWFLMLVPASVKLQDGKLQDLPVILIVSSDAGRILGRSWL